MTVAGKPIPQPFIEAAARVGLAQRTPTGVQFHSEDFAQRLAEFGALVQDAAIKSANERHARVILRMTANAEIARALMESDDD